MCLSFILLTGNAIAVNVTVDCNGTGDYTSIQSAIDNASSGDSIIVMPGIYAENLLVDRSVSIASGSGNPEDTVIQPSNLTEKLISINADNVVVNGFTVTGANASKAMFLYESSGCLIENNIVSSNKYGIYLNNSDNNEVVNNTLLSNNFIGLCLFESDDNSVRSTYSSGNFIGFDLVSSCNNILSDNTLESDGVYGIYFHQYSHDNSILHNNISNTYDFEPLGASTLISASMEPISSNENKEFDVYLFADSSQKMLNEFSISEYDQSSTSTAPGVYGGLGLFLNKDNTGNIIVSNVVENSYIRGMYFGYGSSGNIIYDNYFSNTDNFYQYYNNTNIWNITLTPGENIAGGPYLGGNCWTNPSGTDFSQTHVDLNDDGICDGSYAIDSYNVDELPLYSYQNLLPEASIFSISPGYVKTGELVHFAGIGIDHDGYIQEYNWRSSIDGELSNDAYFTANTLSPGNHTIYCKVKDNDDEWSAEVSELLIVENDNEAYIRSQVYNGTDLQTLIGQNAVYVENGNYAIEINSSNFGAFNYDLNTDAGSEFLRIFNYTNISGSSDGRTIEEGQILYNTSILQVAYEADFDNEEVYGSTYPTTYPSIGFFGERYVSLSDENPDEIVKLLLDSDDKYVIRKSFALELPEGYALTAKQIDVEGDKVWMELSQNGEFLEDEVIDISGGPATWEYDLDIGDEDNVIVFRLLITDLFAGQVDDLVVVEGIWLVDFENIINVEAGYTFNEMEVLMVDSNLITMTNLNSLYLQKDKNLQLANNLFFKIADDNDLRFCLIKINNHNMSYYSYRSGYYYIPSHTATGPDSFDYSNFAGFYYNLDENISTEKLVIKQPLGDLQRTIDSGNITYTTTIHNINFSCNELNSDNEKYEVLGMFGKTYVPLESNNPGKLMQLLLDTNKEYLLCAGDKIELTNGYGLHYRSYDLDNNQFTIELLKGNNVYDENFSKQIVLDEVSGDATCEFRTNVIGIDDVLVMKIHLRTVENSPVSGQLIVDGIWLADYLDVIGIYNLEEFGNFYATICNNSIIFVNEDELSLTSNKRLELADGLYIEVAKNDSLSYCLLREESITDNNQLLDIDSSLSEQIISYRGDIPVFDINASDYVNITWYLDGKYEQINQSVITASYYPTISDSGIHSITAVVSNENDTAIMKWKWNIVVPYFPTYPAGMDVEIRSPVYDSQEISSIETNGKYIEINGSNFAGFYYDIDKNISTEILRIYNITAINGSNLTGWTINEGEVQYSTTISQVDYAANFADENSFENNQTYPGFCLFGDFFVPISDTNPGKLTKLLVDSDDKYTLRNNSTIELTNNYAITAKMIDVEHNKVWMEFTKDGESIASEIIDVSDGSVTWEYCVDIPEQNDIVVFRLLVTDVFQGQIDGLAVVGGIWIRDYKSDWLEIEEGDEFGELEVAEVNTNSISMYNFEQLNLTSNSEVYLGEGFDFKVANSDEPSFYLKEDILSSENYEVRGTVISGPFSWYDELSWDYKDFAGFVYDLDTNIGTERLSITHPWIYSNSESSTIEFEYMWYETSPVQIDYKADFDPENNEVNNMTYTLIGLFGDRYVSFNDTVPSKLARLIIDSDSEYTLNIGSPLELPLGYELIVTDVDTNTTANIEIRKDGEMLFIQNVSSSTDELTWEYKTDVGPLENITVFRTNINEIKSTSSDSYIILSGIWLVGYDDYFDVKSRDTYGVFMVDTVWTEIRMFNYKIITLDKGSDVDLADDIKLRVADTDTWIFYPYREYEITVNKNNQIPSVSDFVISSNTLNYGSSVTFSGNGTDQDGSIVACNWRSNIDGQLSTELSFTSSDLSVGNHTIYFKVKDDNGDWSDENSENILVNPVSPTTSTSTSSGGGGGGGGGGGTTGELYENIAFKDVRSEFVTKDSVTSYDFTDEDNELEYIQFTASRNWGQISATVECLHDTSALVDKEPEGTVYRNLNIWVGKSGFSENIEDCVIGFKVSKEWLAENEVDEGSVRLLHYSDGEWEELDTELVDEDDEYLHFKATTSGFSPFAIVGDSKLGSVDQGDTEISTGSADDEAVSTDNLEGPASKSIPAFEGVVSILAFLLAGYCMAHRKKG